MTKMIDIPSDVFQDEYSAFPSEEETIVITLDLPQKDDKVAQAAAAPRKEEKAAVAGFYPTKPVIYPNLKFVLPNLEEDEGAETKPWKKLPNTRDTYFNYGFTEEVWEAYKFKQNELRKLFGQKRRENGHSRDQKKRSSKH